VNRHDISYSYLGDDFFLENKITLKVLFCKQGMGSYKMKATAELQVVPIGSGVSVRNEIACVVDLLQLRDFIIQPHASGTNIEGELPEILAVLEDIHQTLHDKGTVRLISYLKLETRTDKVPSLAGKKL
jgi:uncharacterized protein (TIGR00106 family)